MIGNKKIAFLIMLFVLNINIVSAYSETVLFDGGGTFTDTSSKGGGHGTIYYNTCFGSIGALTMNANNVKGLEELTLSNTFYTYYTTGTAALGAGASGLNQKLVSVTATISGNTYATGYIGWKRTTGNNFNYWLIFDYLNYDYAKNLTGTQIISLSYDSTVYCSYVASQTLGTDNGYETNYNYVRGQSAIYSSTYGWEGISFVSLATVYRFDDEFDLYWNNVTDSAMIINVTKHSNSARVTIYNQTSYDYYNVSSTSAVSEIVPIETGIYLRLYDNIALDYITRTVFSSSSAPDGITGTVTTNKSEYNQTETVNITYSFTGAEGYGKRVQIAGYSDTSVIYTSPITDSAGTRSYYIPESVLSQEYSVYIQVQVEGLWETVDYADFYIYPKDRVSQIRFSSGTYNLGDSIKAISFINSSGGYLYIKNPSSQIMQTFSTTANTSQETDYYLTQSDLTGTWTAELYNSSSTLIDSDTAIINFHVITDDNVSTATASAGTTSLIDITDQLSVVVFGDIKDSSGRIGDNEIASLGTNLFGTFLLIAFVCLIAGAYHMVKNRRRR